MTTPILKHKLSLPLFLLIFCILFVPKCCARGKSAKHHFATGENVDLWANYVGPFSNPSETYQFYNLPFCHPSKYEWRSQRLGQVMSGDRSILSQYDIPFGESFKNKRYCEYTLSEDAVNRFTKAVSEYYYFELIFDDLPVFGFVGNFNGETYKYYIFTHWDFIIQYNGDQVIHINLTTPEDSLQELVYPSPSFSFTYSVKWISTHVPFEDRRDIYQNQFGFPFRSELKIRWISITNSFVIVLFLASFLIFTVLKLIRSELSFYILDKEEGMSDSELYGWKVIRGDVFRFPPYLSLFCGFIGIGCQFMSIVVGTLILALLGVIYPTNSGNIYAACIVLYALTAGFGGYVSAQKYKQFGGKNWLSNLLLVGLGLFAVPFACSFAFLNGIAIHFELTAALPFITILEVSSIWLFVGIPLTVVGGKLGRRYAGEFHIPTRPRATPRPIPYIPLYLRLPFQMVVAGLIPFAAIYIELLFIYSSVWGHYYYTFYGVLCLVFVILNVVTGCVTVSLTYFQFSREDYRWWWASFLNGGSTAIYIYIYSIYYFIYQTKMIGLLQAAFYFTYLLVSCYVCFVLLGTVGFFSSLIFVKMIYHRIGGCD